MKTRNLLLTLCSLVVFFQVRGQQREEFNGPLRGWADVKQRFGAKGNGKDDDTRAFQNALDSLSNPVTGFHQGKDGYMVIYVPAGTYCISSTLVLKGKIGICILGEDPARTVIKWTGADNDTIFWANGSAYFKLSRFTWNANGRKGMEGIGLHWKDIWKDAHSQSFAALNIDLSDNFFVGAFKYGISGGTGGGNGTGANDSEITIRRCLFDSCTDAGIYINSFNALDYWIWDSKFIDCKVAVYCIKGNYHAYRSFFSGSTLCDFRNDNCYYTSVRGCYSRNANGWSADFGVSGNPFKRIFQDNTVINPKGFAIEYYHLGKITLWDNRLARIKDTSLHYWVHTGSWAPGIYEIMSMDNKYEINAPLNNNRSPMHNYVVGDSYSGKVKDDPSAFLATMEKTPPKVTRKIFELSEGATTEDIQSAINQAAALNGSRPVVHLSAGVYYIDKTLHIPPHCDLQLCGDGLLNATRIYRRNIPAFLTSPMLWVEGPTAVTIHDMQWGIDAGPEAGSAFVFTNVDQPASEAHIEQLDCRADTSIFTDRLNYLYTEKDNSFFSNGTTILGGNRMTDPHATAKVCCFGAQFVNTNVRNGGVFIAKDCWWEGNLKVPLGINGSGKISIDGAMIAPNKMDSTPVITIDHFNGSISLMNIYLYGAILPGAGLNGLDLLVWNVHVMHKMNALDFFRPGLPYRAAFLGLTTQCFDPKNKACNTIESIPDQTNGINDLPAFLETMTAPTRRDKPVTYHNLPGSASNIYISRVNIGSLSRGITFTNGK